MRGISLDEIVATTKIGTRLLRALENEQFELLPGGIFNKSYVRAYAKCVGMDEEEAVAAYMEAANEEPPDNRVIAHQASFHSDRLPEEPTGFPIVPVLILLVVIVGGIAGWKVYRDRLHDREVLAPSKTANDATSPSTQGDAPANGNSAQPVARSSPAPTATPPATRQDTLSTRSASPQNANTPAPSPSSAAGSAAASTPANAAAGTPFEVVIRPKDSAWVSIKSDGKFVVRGIIRPPDVKTIHATSQIVFWTGNAGAVEVSFNGKSVPLPGDANQEGVLVFDSRGVMRHPAAVAAQ